MAVNGEVELNWADGSYKFNMAKFKGILELEENCKAGVAEIMKRIVDDRWYWNDLREPLRIGLIGAGMAPDKALRLINLYCDGRPWEESRNPALVVLWSARLGVKGDEVGKKAETDRTKEDQPSETMAGLSDPLFTASAQQSDLAQDKPTK